MLPARESGFPTPVGMNRNNMYVPIANLAGSVFPTPVGMNRLMKTCLIGRIDSVPHARGDEPFLIEYVGRSVPHARGDEPIWLHGKSGAGGVFPTPVGMNRRYNGKLG